MFRRQQLVTSLHYITGLHIYSYDVFMISNVNFFICQIFLEMRYETTAKCEEITDSHRLNATDVKLQPVSLSTRNEPV